MASIILTDKCNLQCSYCFANEFTNKAFTEISAENFHKALDFALTEGLIKYYRCDYMPEDYVRLLNSFKLYYEQSNIWFTSDEKGDFFVLQNPVTVKLAGGEPLLHSRFDYLLKELLKNDSVSQVIIYTNGVYLDRYFDLFKNPKCYFLINCNSPEIIGYKTYNKILSNIKMFEDNNIINRVSVGYNIYDINADYTYILDLLSRFRFSRLRTSVVCPDLKRDDFRTSESNFLYFKNY